ncbi:MULTISPECIES: hypothetical protein [Clostridium]|jgi:hypothetical protein|uniref:hypothetical protein n=1 Tax=Clostridium TaxID=1485 RepID=UPI000E915356|nr:hypothetical protein [Clostridium tyrobutyricum]HBF76981.1 hypothetical protein [Clostridiaceae bacterium]
MDKLIKKYSIIFLLTIFCLTSNWQKAYASGKVGTKVAYPTPVAGSVTVKGPGTFISTSEWEQETYYKYEQYWVDGTPEKFIQIGSSGSGKQWVHIPGTPGHYTTIRIPMQRWVIKPSGYNVFVSGEIELHMDETYLFTENNIKDNGEPAGLHYKAYIKNVYVESPLDGEVPGTIVSPYVSHTVNRYQNKGKYYAPQVESTKAINGNSAVLTGKFEYPYAGDGDSYLGCGLTVTAILTKEEASAIPGITNKVKYKFTSEPIYECASIPVNAFNSVNYTGSKKRKTDLMFKKGPIAPDIYWRFKI